MKITRLGKKILIKLEEKEEAKELKYLIDQALNDAGEIKESGFIEGIQIIVTV